jgi:hypothetical protein
MGADTGKPDNNKRRREMKFTSRKFLLTLGAVLVAVGSALNGEITWSQTVWASVTAVLGYVGIEGARDIKATP